MHPVSFNRRNNGKISCLDGLDHLLPIILEGPDSIVEIVTNMWRMDASMSENNMLM
jgi:hypothetical protein